MKVNKVYTKLFLQLSLENYLCMNYWKISTKVKKKKSWGWKKELISLILQKKKRKTINMVKSPA